MFGKLGELKDNLKTLKDLQGKLTNMDMSSPDSMRESMKMLGLDVDEIEKTFYDQYNQKLVVEYVLNSDNEEPQYHYETDSGFDLRANEDVTLEPLERALVPTGMFINIPNRYEIQVRPKSGLTINKGLTVLNTPGTVDNGYTGEIKVIMINLDKNTQTIKKGDKIAQAVICPVIVGGEVQLKRTDKLIEKDRNSNGFGSTGN
jgi:dUTP pyrophosphatase